MAANPFLAKSKVKAAKPEKILGVQQHRARRAKANMAKLRELTSRTGGY